MLTRLYIRTLSLMLGMALLLGGAGPAVSSAEQFLGLKKSFSASTPEMSALISRPSAFIGRTVEITGTVSGIASGGDSANFILNCDGTSLLIRATAHLPSCVSNGNTLRVLVQIGPGSAVSLSDLTMVAAIYEHDISTFEKRSAAKPEPAKAETPAPAKRPDQPTNLATRGGPQSPASRIQEVYAPYRAAIKSFNPRLTEQQLDTITKGILSFSWHYQVDPRLVIAVFLAESNFRPNATSPKGAMGLGQLMPGTARGLGVTDAYDPLQNIEGSIRLIRRHLDSYNDLALALSAYNAGPGAVKRHGGVPPFRETRDYIRKVTDYYRQLRGE